MFKYSKIGKSFLYTAITSDIVVALYGLYTDGFLNNTIKQLVIALSAMSILTWVALTLHLHIALRNANNYMGDVENYLSDKWKYKK